MGRELWPEVLIPVKNLPTAKLRLAEILDRRERSDLVLAMLGDVLAAVQAANLPVSVLSPDAEVLRFASDVGARPLPQPREVRSLNAALASAMATEFSAAAAVLVVLADTPLVTAVELERLSAMACGPESGLGRASSLLVVVPDRHDLGSNALLLRPPDAIGPHFGVNSLSAHLASARTRGVPAAVSRQPGLALDLDTAADVVQFLSHTGGVRTRDLLTRIGASARLT